MTLFFCNYIFIVKYSLISVKYLIKFDTKYV